MLLTPRTTTTETTQSPAPLASLDKRTNRYYGCAPQTIHESVNIVRNYLLVMKSRYQGGSGGTYTRMFNYLTKSIFDTIEFIEAPNTSPSAVAYAKYQVAGVLGLVKAGVTHSVPEITMIINYVSKY